MREIKFRAWDGEEMLPDVVPMSNTEILTVSPLGVDYRMDKVKAIMQYTGLKDSKGVEIYEGDIVNASWQDDYGGESCLGVEVKYEESQGGFAPFANSPFDNRIYEDIEVIGNIYENKELLNDNS